MKRLHTLKATIRAGLVYIIVLVVAGCVASAPAPVINKSPNRKIPDQRVVNAGDSIYSISWLYGVDFLDIAKWNGIKSPYRLNPGQRLRLRPGKGPGGSPAGNAVVVKTLPASTVSSSPISTSPLPAETAPKSKAPPKTQTAARPAAKPKKNAGLPALASPGKWLWPAKGEVIGKYSPKKGVNGIRIAAAAGSPVKASAAGDVVYVGEGLRGYGKLIIVKHSAKFLSAYAHNRRILVAEGDRVRSHQQIAEMGDSGASRTMLHFEIRVNGKPEDPLKYLR